MKKVHTISFSQDKNNKSINSHIKVALVVLTILVFGILSFILLLSKNGFNIDKLIGARNQETTVSENESIVSEDEVVSTHTDEYITGSDEASSTFLFVCYDDNRNVSFSYILEYSSSERELKIRPLKPDFDMIVFTGSTTFSKAFSSINTNQLMNGLLDRGINIDKYVFVSEDRLIDIFQYLGPVSINLESEFTYKVEQIKYSYGPGPTELPAVGMMNYLKEYGVGDNHYKYSCDAAAIIINSYFRETNVSEQGFYKLINLVESDISALDYLPLTDEILELCRTGLKITVDF